MNNLLSINEAADLIKVNPETLRRWDREGKLVAIKVNERGDRRYRESDILEFIKVNPKLIQYGRDIKHGDYSIAWYSEGYLSMTGNFGVIAKITAENDNSWIGFAFAVSGLSLFARTGLKDDLDNLPIEKIKEYIDKGLVSDGDVFTFEFMDGGFREVQNPDWWDGKYSKSLVPGLRVEAHATHPVTMANQAWRVILYFKSKQGDVWLPINFGPEHNLIEYFTWIDSEELGKLGLPNTEKSAEILAVKFGVERFDRTKDKNGNRDITQITEKNSAFYDGKWVEDSLLPDELMSQSIGKDS